MKQYIILLLTLLLFASCEKEIGEFSEYESPRLVINVLSSIDKDLHVNICKTGLTEALPVREYDICLDVNGKEVHRASVKNNGTDYIVPMEGLHPDDRIHIDVTAENLHASAEAIVPQPVSIVAIDTMSVMAKTFSWYSNPSPHTRYMVKLRKPNDSKALQYYRVEMTRSHSKVSSFSIENGIIDKITFTEPETDTTFSYANDPALTESEAVDQEGMSVSFDWLDGIKNKYHVFRSSFFKDGEYTLMLDIPQEVTTYNWRQDVNIRIYGISAIEYQYLLALSAFKVYDPDIFSGEPIMPTNVEGGAGIFCIESVSEINYLEDHVTMKVGDPHN